MEMIKSLKIEWVVFWAVTSIVLHPAWASAEKMTTQKSVRAISTVQAYDDLLQKMVSDGLIDYARAKKHRRAIRLYIDILKNRLDKNQTGRHAFVDFINLYNALTIDLIAKHYPDLASIRDLRAPWDTALIQIGKENLTLNDIEHKKLRKIFKDYRIHFVLVCASLGCPDLRNRSYTYKNIEAELEEETARYLNSPKGSQIKGNQLAISKLFNWYKKDFTPDVKTVLDKYLKDKNKKRLLSTRFGFLDYSWKLNDQKKD